MCVCISFAWSIQTLSSAVLKVKHGWLFLKVIRASLFGLLFYSSRFRLLSQSWGKGAAERSPPKPLLFSQLLQLPGEGPGSVWGMGEVLGFGRTVMGVLSLFLEAGMGRNQPSLGLSPFSPVPGLRSARKYHSSRCSYLRYQRGHEPGLALGNRMKCVVSFPFKPLTPNRPSNVTEGVPGCTQVALFPQPSSRHHVPSMDVDCSPGLLLSSCVCVVDNEHQSSSLSAVFIDF